MKKLFKLKEVKKNIFLLQFSNDYDMCMFFLRYQEYYESPSPKYRGKSFKILDFMRWYSLKFGSGAFTYPTDWSGFNIPGDIIMKVNSLGIPDRNDYDMQMLGVYQHCVKKTGSTNFYIIGVADDTTSISSALPHEIAHGFFYVYPEYKKQMTKLVKVMAPELRETMNKYLLKVGYTPQVFVDETQANMATSKDFTTSAGRHWSSEMADKLTEAQKPFVTLFKKYMRESK
jgi:hypothetical protein